MKKLRIVLAIFVVFIIAMACVLTVQSSNEETRQPGFRAPVIPANYTEVFSKYICVVTGKPDNVTFNVENVSTIESICTVVFSNYTPVQLTISNSRMEYSTVLLGTEANQESSSAVFADPPYIIIYGGTWYMSIEDSATFPSADLIHIFVSVEYEETPNAN
ncbi:MAG: hypothetical protein M1496_01380 [Candidatus Thermoplasmatota archaeon]|nr:hypothetical protein [Candidatus Thermoplasmatota archaeon]